MRRPAGHEVILAVEVAVTSLRRDRRKAALHAAAGVATFWLVDVEAGAVTLYADPRADGSWGSVRRVGEDEELTLPEGAGSLRLCEVLPPL